MSLGLLKIGLVSVFGVCIVTQSVACQVRTPGKPIPDKQPIFDVSQLSETGQRAYKALSAADMFAIGGTGEGGETSPGELALRDLVREKQAIPALRDLLAQATSEGGLYALLGLKVLKCECFEAEYARFANLPDRDPTNDKSPFQIKNGEVHRMSGCEIYSEERLKVAKDIAEGNDEIINFAIKNWPGDKTGNPKL